MLFTGALVMVLFYGSHFFFVFFFWLGSFRNRICVVDALQFTMEWLMITMGCIAPHFNTHLAHLSHPKNSKCPLPVIFSNASYAACRLPLDGNRFLLFIYFPFLFVFDSLFPKFPVYSFFLHRRTKWPVKKIKFLVFFLIYK